MNEQALNFLKRLLDIPSPSGDEAAAGKIWREEAQTFTDDVRADVRGNSFAVLKGGAPRVLMTGHIDEIGVMVSYIDDDGFVYFAGVGGWDPQVLVGQRVHFVGKDGDVVGVVGKKPIHLQEDEERSKASKMKNLWIDIGAKNREDVEKLIRIGTVGVLEGGVHEMPNGRLVARGLDDRIGASIVLETLRQLAADAPQATIAAVATCQEEVTLAGARTSAFSFDPHVGLAVDVTFTTDHPESNKKEDGDVRLGGGPVLSRGAANSPVMFDMLLKIAEQEQIPYQVQVTPRRTGTDADQIHITRGGVATATVSIPCRYLHTPNEMIELIDVENAIKLMCSFVRSLTPDTDFIPR